MLPQDMIHDISLAAVQFAMDWELLWHGNVPTQAECHALREKYGGVHQGEGFNVRIVFPDGSACRYNMVWQGVEIIYG